MAITINPCSWRSRSNPRGGRRAGTTLPGLPAMFLPPDADVSEELTLEPAAATRGEPVAGRVLDLTSDVLPDQVAILAIRHPSGALTFHLPVESTSRGARGPSRVRFQVSVPVNAAGTATRGIVGKIIKAIVVRVAKLAGDKLMSLLLPKLVEAFERRSWQKRGLTEGWLRVTKETLAGGKLAPGAPVSPERSLLFVHGTFSNAASAFGPLGNSDFFERVKDAYDDRLFAFDHFSLSRTPEENARMLLAGLPDQTTTFDVVTHSRGGLVLRTLVERAGEFGALSRRFQLGRAVLVASPNEGTPLATPDRWKQTVGWIANLLELFPDNPLTIGAEFVANGLVWLANHASGDIPGLHAMDGRGRPIAELQDPPGPRDDAYSALVANYNPEGAVLQRLVDAGLDEFFGGANDLVVPTAGGWQVDRSSKVFIPAARIGCFGPGGNIPEDSVTHVTFFTRPETVDFLVDALEDRRHALNGVDPRAPLPDRRLSRGADATRSRAAAIAPAAASARPAAPVERLHVAVVNGNLKLEAGSLLLGHYVSTQCTGAEAAMDKLIGRALSHSVRIGLYPQQVGSHQVFMNDFVGKDGSTLIPRPAAVIVVGLGPEGQLRPGDLITAVRQGVIAWARRAVEPGSAAEWQPFFKLASTLMGSGGIRVSAGDAAGLITQGVLEANELLRDPKDGERPLPRCSHLRLIELYLDRATEAWRALRMRQSGETAEFELEESVVAAEGGLVRPSEWGYRGANYDFVTVELRTQRAGRPVLEYSLDTKRSRSEVRGQQTQSRLLRQLVETASSDQNRDQRIGRTLFNLLIPVELEPYLAGSGELQMALDPETAAIPWELLDVNRDAYAPQEPWALRVKLIRQLRLTRFRERVEDAGAQDSVLVIGEPQCPPDYPRLDGARDEALAVHERLMASGRLDASRVTLLAADDPSLPGPNAESVINALFEKSWRIVHIAGHGAPEEHGRPGGVVLSNGTFIGPDEIRSLRTVPELVFVNCCYLARGDANQFLKARYDRARFASGIAGALIEIGVRCVVAAGWAVDDGAAKAFATAFYASLLTGARFIDAVADGREAAYKLAPDVNTWAAYQCYGDPDWKFKRGGEDPNASVASSEDFLSVASATALRLALDSIIVQSSSESDDAGSLLADVRRLEQQFAKRWGASGEIAERFGLAYFETGALESAMHWLERAVDAPDATATIKSAEQLGNARCRYAWEIVDRASRHDREMARRLGEAKGGRAARAACKAAGVRLRHAIREALRLIELARTRLQELADVKATMERESLIASAYKRRAMVNIVAGQEARARRDVALTRTTYEKALRVGRTERGADTYYPALNCLAAAVASGADRRGRIELDAKLLKIVRDDLAAKNSANKADFWSAVGDIEIKQYEAMAERRLGNAATLKALRSDYDNLHRRVTSARKWASVYDNHSLVLGRYADARSSVPQTEREAAAKLLKAIRDIARPTQND